MNKLLVLLVLLQAPQAMACEFSTGIQETDGGYLYSPDCHKEVGRMKKEIDERRYQKLRYEELLGIKDRQIELEQMSSRNWKAQSELWKETAVEVHERSSSIERLSESNKWLYIGAGVLLTVISGYAIGSTAHATSN